MKKIISLTVSIGLAAILFIIFISFFLQAGASSAKPIVSADVRQPEQGGPDWFDAAWHYRRPVTISNSGATLSWYQVSIRLNNSNFNFSHAKTDGSDVRFAYIDGITPLKYWIEAWDSAKQLAYVWVRVPNLTSGSMTIYLYYGNPTAVSASDGTTTFERFDDDWDEFAGEGIIPEEDTPNLNPMDGVRSPFDWAVLSGTPTATLGILNLSPGTGISSYSTHLYQTMGMRANFGLGAGYEWAGFINGDIGKRTMIGDTPLDPTNLYLIDHRTNFDIVLIPRVGGTDWHNEYHVYEVRWSSAECVGDIDHGASTVTSSVPSQVPDEQLPVTLYSHAGSNATLLVDWIYIRQYRDPEPTAYLGSEQGLVELSINTIDNPDPLPSDTVLTYNITISNTSPINAPGVVMTDTLSWDVAFLDVSSSQGSCARYGVILCNLGVINSNSTASVTIHVSPYSDGEVTNLAEVGSPGFELNLSDNTSEEDTLVDSVPPSVNWLEPVGNGGTYYTFGGLVTLQASATDNDQVAYVEYQYFDHVHTGQWISIGSASTDPYQVQFDTSVLEVTPPDHPYQTDVIGVDRAGNQSDPAHPLRVIYFLRRSAVYMPLLTK